MSDFKVGDLVTINYGERHRRGCNDPVYGIIVKIDRSVETNVKVYRVSQANYNWILPYSEHELRSYNHDKPIGQPKTKNDLRTNQEEDGKERGKAHKESRQ